VGKTTLSCATALRLARDFPQKRILLFSTDPAHSLSACLGQEVGPQPVPVVAGLSALEIDAHAEFEALKAQYAGDIKEFLQSVAAGFDLTFDRVVMERMMDLAPPGVDEMMALTRILDLLIHRRYDLFVLDSAATGHFIRLIELPALLDQWLKTFFSVLLKYQRLLQLPRFCAQLVELSKNLKQFRVLLGDRDRAVLYVVSILARMAWEETKDLLAACDRLSLHVPALFLNRMTPPGDCRFCGRLRSRERSRLKTSGRPFLRSSRYWCTSRANPQWGGNGWRNWHRASIRRPVWIWLAPAGTDEMKTNGKPALELSGLDDLDRVSLCEALDRVLNKGAVVSGEVTIAVAGVELVYLGFELVLTSVETARAASGLDGAGLTLAIGEKDAGRVRSKHVRRV
jgi:TRC40/GET3/ArsA family transport-energizing ATPase